MIQTNRNLAGRTQVVYAEIRWTWLGNWVGGWCSGLRDWMRVCWVNTTAIGFGWYERWALLIRYSNDTRLQQVTETNPIATRNKKHPASVLFRSHFRFDSIRFARHPHSRLVLPAVPLSVARASVSMPSNFMPAFTSAKSVSVVCRVSDTNSVSLSVRRLGAIVSPPGDCVIAAAASPADADSTGFAVRAVSTTEAVSGFRNEMKKKTKRKATNKIT